MELLLKNPLRTLDCLSCFYCNRMDLDVSDPILSANERSSSYTNENKIDGTALPIGYSGCGKNKITVFGEYHDKQSTLQDYGLAVRGNQGQGVDIGSRMFQLGISNVSKDQIMNVDQQHIPESSSSPTEQQHSDEDDIVIPIGGEGSTSSAVRDGMDTNVLTPPEPSAAPCSNMPFLMVKNIHSRRYHLKKCQRRGCPKEVRCALKLRMSRGGGGGGSCKQDRVNGLVSKSAHCKSHRCRITSYHENGEGRSKQEQKCTSKGHRKPYFLIKQSGEKRSSSEGCLLSSYHQPKVFQGVHENRRTADDCCVKREDLCTVHGGASSMEIDETNLNFQCPWSTSISFRGSVVENGLPSSSMNAALEAVTLPPAMPKHSLQEFEDVDGLGSNKNTSRVSEIVVPEGRVHGGTLMLMLGGSFANASLGGYGTP